MKILVHITHRPENPTTAALGFHVAKAAVDEGHSVTVLLAGDAVQLMRDAVIERLSGLGTHDVQGLYQGPVATGTKFYLSGVSPKTRGLGEGDLRGKNYVLAARKNSFNWR